MKLHVNGVLHQFEGDPERTLLDYLRADLGILSPKDACSSQAACGACTVDVNGKPTLSCVTPLRKLEGAAVTTTEGLPEREQDAFADAFHQHGGTQCGFCTPGIVMRGHALLAKTPSPTTAEVEKSLTLHLCRCTGYKKIVSSVQAAGEALRTGEPVPKPPQTGRVGTRLPKVQSRELVLGQHAYVCDRSAEGMVHGALRFSDHPRAIVRAIDVAAALASPGVLRVLVASDIPGKHESGLIVADWPLMIGVGETTHYVGDVLACVVAATPEQAREAASKVKVDYEVLTPILDVPSALAEGAPSLHPKGNVLGRSIAKKGDVEAAFAECAFITEHTYQTQMIEHAYMEHEACLALPKDGGVKLFSQSQGVYEDRRQVALLLDLPEDRVEVELVENGGAFGGKEDLSVQGHAALAAHLLRVPVKIELTRDESIRMHPKRHPLRLEYKVGCTKEGKLHALRARITGDTGAYASVGLKVLERAAGHATGAYQVPNVDVIATAVYTNNLPCGAMRGFGANQATFALECSVDELCEQGGFDRYTFRWDNALVEGSTTSTGQVLTSGVGVRKCLEAVEPAFRAAKFAGIACGLKNTGIGNGMQDIGRAKIVVHEGGRIDLHHGWTEMGQGVHTMAVQAFCEQTGLDPASVTVIVDTSEDVACGMTTASRGTSLVGNGVIAACKDLVRDLQTQPITALAGKVYRGEWICDWSTKPGYENGRPIVTHYSYSYAAQVVIVNDEGVVTEVVAAHDAGRVMNPMLFEGQIEGSIHMGLGYALTEALPLEGGFPKSTKLRDCGILRAHETPAIRVIGVEVPDQHGPFGAKGVGEIGLVPTAGAVANALFAQDGVRRRTLPMRRTK